jgi:hypothetical protein
MKSQMFAGEDQMARIVSCNCSECLDAYFELRSVVEFRINVHLTWDAGNYRQSRRAIHTPAPSFRSRSLQLSVVQFKF